MGKKLPKEQMELYKFIGNILLQEWDPIGVNGVPEAADEYNSYLPVVFNKAMNNESAEAIANYLKEIEMERMSLNCNMQKNKEIALKIINKKMSTVGVLKC